MPYLLEDLVIDRVDLVDEGANSAAFITLFKRKELEYVMDFKEILEKMLPEHAAVVQAEVTKAAADKQEISQKLSTTITDLAVTTDKLAKANAELEQLKKSKTGEPSEEDILKGLSEDARAVIAKFKEQKEAAEESLRKAREAEEHATAVVKAAELKALPVPADKLLEVVKNSTPEMLEVLTTISKAVENTVLGEVGKARPGSAAAMGDVAWEKIEAKAMEVVKATGISKAKAISQVVEQNPDLYKEYLKGGAN